MTSNKPANKHIAVLTDTEPKQDKLAQIKAEIIREIHKTGWDGRERWQAFKIVQGTELAHLQMPRIMHALRNRMRYWLLMNGYKTAQVLWQGQIDEERLETDYILFIKLQ